MPSLFTPENLRARQVELSAEIEAIKSKTIPMREARDSFSRQADAQLREMNDAIKAAEAPLFDLQQEAGMIAKALGGKAMSRSAA